MQIKSGLWRWPTGQFNLGCRSVSFIYTDHYLYACMLWRIRARLDREIDVMQRRLAFQCLPGGPKGNLS